MALIIAYNIDELTDDKIICYSIEQKRHQRLY